VAGKHWIAVEQVARPTMTVYPARGTNTGAAVIVFPGGGYKILAIDLEGSEVCDWLASRGITAVLLKYRVPDSGPHWDPTCKCHKDPKAPMALQDAQRTAGLVRAHAAEWRVDPHKIGVLGFSAGGPPRGGREHALEQANVPGGRRRRFAELSPGFRGGALSRHMLEKTTRGV